MNKCFKVGELVTVDKTVPTFAGQLGRVVKQQSSFTYLVKLKARIVEFSIAELNRRQSAHEALLKTGNPDSIELDFSDIYPKDVTMPEGWKPVRFGIVKNGDSYLNATTGLISVADNAKWVFVRLIVEPIKGTTSWAPSSDAIDNSPYWDHQGLI